MMFNAGPARGSGSQQAHQVRYTFDLTKDNHKNIKYATAICHLKVWTILNAMILYSPFKVIYLNKTDCIVEHLKIKYK